MPRYELCHHGADRPQADAANLRLGPSKGDAVADAELGGGNHLRRTLRLCIMFYPVYIIYYITVDITVYYYIVLVWVVVIRRGECTFGAVHQAHMLR